MYDTRRLLVGFLLGLLVLRPLSARAEFASSPVVLSEAAWAGSTRTTADEWLELANRGSDSVDVSGWFILGAGTSGSAIELPAATIISPNDTLLIANYKLGDKNTTLTASPELVTTSLSLPNESLHLTLAMADGLVVDELLDAGKPDAGSSTTFASMERQADGTWATATTSIGLLDNQLGTPGFSTLPSISATSTPDVIATVDEPVAELPANAPLASEDVVPEIAVAEDAPLILVVASTDEATVPELDAPATAPSEPTVTAPPESAELDAAPEQVAAPTDEPIASDAAFTMIPIVTTESAPAEPETAQIEAPVLDAPELSAPEADVIVAAIDPIETPVENVVAPIIESPRDPLLPKEGQGEVAPEPTEPTATLCTAIAGRITLSEFMSRPSDNHEWVELYNSASEDIALDGCMLADATGKTTVLAGSISAGGYILVNDPAGKLNNDGDTLELQDGAGNVVDAIAYGNDAIKAPGKDASLSRNGTDWELAPTPTPGAANTFIEAVLEEPLTESTYDTPNINADADTASPAATPTSNVVAPSAASTSRATKSPAAPASDRVTRVTPPVSHVATSSADTKARSSVKSASASSSTRSVAVDGVSALNAGVKVVTQGVIVALPGTFGNQIAFIDGLELYMNSADWPELTIGDEVRVEGVISIAQGNHRIKLASRAGITVVGHRDTTAASPSSLNNVTHGELVTLAGILEKEQGDFALVLSSGERIVLELPASVSSRSLTPGQATITGIVRLKNGNMTLAPRSEDDISIAQTPNNAISSAIAGTIAENDAPTSGASSFTGLALAAAAAGFLGICYALARRMKRTAPSTLSTLKTQTL